MAENKELLLAKIISIFKRNGISGVTMDQIAAVLGITKKTLYNHFNNKQAIRNSICNHLMQESYKMVDSILEVSNDAIDELLLWYKHKVAYIKEYGKLLYQEMPTQLVSNMEHTFAEEYRNVAITYVRNNIVRGQKEAIYRSNINAFFIADFFVISSMYHTLSHLPHLEVNHIDFHFQVLMYHIHGIANAKGVVLLEQYIQNNTNI